jgi:tetratricopeptide (TPR) repeat protein
LYFVAHIRGRMGQRAEAEQAYDRQIELLTALIRDFPNEWKYKFDLFHSHLALAHLLNHRAQAKAEDAFRKAASLITQLAQDYPDEPNYRDAKAAVTIQLGRLRIDQKDYKEGERLIREALGIAEQLDRAFPNKPTTPHYPVNIARSLEALAGVQVSTGRMREAEDSYSRALTVWEKLAITYAHQREEAAYREYAITCRYHLGHLMQDRGEFLRAYEWFEQTLPGAQRQAREFPKQSGRRYMVANLHLLMGYSLYGAVRRKEAEESFDRYVKLTEELIELFKEDNELKWYFVEELCRFPLSNSHMYARAMALAEVAKASAIPRILGMAYYRAGRWPESIRELEKDTQELNGVALFLAMAHWKNGDQARARRLYDQTASKMDSPGYTQYGDRCLRAEAEALLGVAKPR